MFFDCTALLAGLIAAVVSRWPPNDKFSYGYVLIIVQCVTIVIPISFPFSDLFLEGLLEQKWLLVL